MIGPGAGTRMNAPAYEGLEATGWDVSYARVMEYDMNPAVQTETGFLYPPGWEKGEPDITYNGGINLATLADNVVVPMIEQLIAEGRGPAAIIFGSRGGQVTLPRLWNLGWRGPTLCINGGCVTRTRIPGAPVRLMLVTCGQDNFETRDPQVTTKECRIRKEDANEPVLMYHNHKDGHMPTSFVDVVGPLLSITISEESFRDTAATAAFGNFKLPQPQAQQHGGSIQTI